MRSGFQDNVFVQLFEQGSSDDNYIPNLSPTLVDQFQGHYVDLSPSPEKTVLAPEMQGRNHRLLVHGSNVSNRDTIFRSKLSVKVTKVLDPDYLIWRDVTDDEAARLQFTMEKALLGPRGSQKIILILKTGAVY